MIEGQVLHPGARVTGIPSPTNHENAPGLSGSRVCMQHLKNSLSTSYWEHLATSCPPNSNGPATDGFMSRNLTTPQTSSDQSAQAYPGVDSRLRA